MENFFAVAFLNPLIPLAHRPSRRVGTPHHDGTQLPDIIHFFVLNGLYPAEVDVLLHECGVYFSRRTRHDDGISDARRLELQELSTRDDC